MNIRRGPLPPARRWALLLILSIAFAALLELTGLPAALLLGPLAAAILLAVRGHAVTVPRLPFIAAQAAIGCMISGTMTHATFGTVAAGWPLFLATTAVTLGASSLLGYLLARWQVLPGTAAIWGSAPGASTTMVLMARAYGADERLVAVMAYTRVVCVASLAALLALALTGHAGRHSIGWTPGADPLSVFETLGIGAVGAAGAIRLHMPAGALLGPLLLGAALNIAGLVHPALPIWLLVPSYAIIGWWIGLSFTGETLDTALRAFPRLLLSIGLLICACAAIGMAMSRLAGIDPVTAFLATSPGGMDSIAIISASTPVDVPFVMAMQAARFIGVLIVGPPLARFVAERGRPAGDGLRD